MRTPSQNRQGRNVKGMIMAVFGHWLDVLDFWSKMEEGGAGLKYEEKNREGKSSIQIVT